MNVSIIIRYDGVDSVLPVNPAQLRIYQSGANHRAETIKLGEINILRTPQLRSLSIESFLPINEDRPYVKTKKGFKKPSYYIKLFKRIRADKKPFMLIITGIKSCFYCSVESLDTWHLAGDADTHYSLKLKEYRPFGRSATELNLVESVNDDESLLFEKPTTTRQAQGFAIGDKVLVNGNYWQYPTGGIPYAPTPLTMMAMPFSSAISLKSIDINTVNNFTARISSVEKSPLIGSLPVLYNYKIAGTDRKSLGWVSKEQLVHI